MTGAKFSKGELKRLIPVYQEGAVDTDLLEEGKRNLRERLEPIDVVRAKPKTGTGASGMADRIRARAGFPARMQRWCTRELKLEPLREYHDQIEAAEHVIHRTEEIRRENASVAGEARDLIELPVEV